MIKVTYSEDYLAHHGVYGQKWGVRRYQNKDGTRTEEGKRRLRAYGGSSDSKETKSNKSPINEMKDFIKNPSGNKFAVKLSKKASKASDKIDEELAKQATKVAEKETKKAKKKISEMTDEEIRKATDRLNLETNYLDALSRNASALSKKDVESGKSFLDKTVDTTKKISDLLNNAANISNSFTTMANNKEKLSKAKNDNDKKENSDNNNSNKNEKKEKNNNNANVNTNNGNNKHNNSNPSPTVINIKKYVDSSKYSDKRTQVYSDHKYLTVDGKKKKK